MPQDLEFDKQMRFWTGPKGKAALQVAATLNSTKDIEMDGASWAEEQGPFKVGRENDKQGGWVHTVRKLNTKLKNYNYFAKQ